MGPGVTNAKGAEVGRRELSGTACQPESRRPWRQRQPARQMRSHALHVAGHARSEAILTPHCCHSSNQAHASSLTATRLAASATLLTDQPARNAGAPCNSNHSAAVRASAQASSSLDQDSASV